MTVLFKLDSRIENSGGCVISAIFTSFILVLQATLWVCPCFECYVYDREQIRLALDLILSKNSKQKGNWKPVFTINCKMSKL